MSADDHTEGGEEMKKPNTRGVVPSIETETENGVAKLGVDSKYLAGWLHTTVAAIHQQRRRGTGPPYSRHGRMVRYWLPDADSWMRRGGG